MDNSFPVSIIMERRLAHRGQWTWPDWKLVAVVAGENLATERSPRIKVYGDGEGERYLWTGFALQLYKDSAESYWYNLMGERPSLFVVCQEDAELERDGELAPFIISANQDEALAHMETDDLVLSAPMPPVIHQWVERYVLTNYVPQEKKKRKRRDWAKEVNYGRRPQAKDRIRS